MEKVLHPKNMFFSLLTTPSVFAVRDFILKQLFQKDSISFGLTWGFSTRGASVLFAAVEPMLRLPLNSFCMEIFPPSQIHG